MKTFKTLSCLCLWLAFAAAGFAQSAQETPEQFAARTQWWRDAKFGMFIHWGIYSVPADGEWHFFNHKMQVKDYERYADQFNPVNFNAEKWVQVAKNAGMKYIVITSKHHDGFCMFDTKLTDYCITKATPFKRDPMKELAAACKKAGIRLCFYHSIMDWHHPDYLPRRPWETETRPADGASLDRYIEYMKGELRELLTNYGPIGVLWFDGGWEHNAEQLHSLEVDRMIRSLQPGILINDRNQLPEDFSTPEQSIPAGAMSGGRLWETCMTLNDHWGYARDDHNWKSTEDLVHKLCDIAHKGGNFLLNVGPTELGEIPEPSIERLAEVGVWMKVNSAAIYGTTQSPYKRLPFDGRCTAKGNRLYLHVFAWPADGLKLAGLVTQVRSARTLKGERLRVTLEPASETDAPKIVAISQPESLDPLATVVELRLAGPPEVIDLSPIQKAEANGTFVLKAIDAEVHGQAAHYEQGDDRDNIGFWINAQDYVTWTCNITKPGRYRVELLYACQPGSEDSQFTIGLDGGAKVSGTVKSTGSWGAFKSETLGQLDLPSGKQTIAVRATSMPKGAVMNLRQVRLVPAS
ncbi:MAG: alpha-L-fucosidase [Candidatus Omnitrophica bacterium]|nr:alpha-L-fucosidase [Candidatus Omnitrophota bacterium]